jgi:2-keto-4-pentenoate hydratase/2-oxohepta-3-ene-1,7-dioic acid hydratase in catechol pathway
MKIYRFKHDGGTGYGILREDRLYPVRGSIYRRFKIEDRGIPIGGVMLLSPVRPSKIVAVGRNYRAHADERGRPVPQEPLLFLKPPSAVIGPGDSILYPGMSRRVDYEGELAVVIKKRTTGLREGDEVSSRILGYTCCNDVTARDLQDKDGQWTRAKSFDSFAPLGPCIVTDLDASDLQLKTFLNGKLHQSGRTRNLIFSIPALVRYISRVMTLNPGDVITTGTPAGIGPMQPGDRVDVQIEGIGTLSNTVLRVKSEGGGRKKE